VARGGCRNPIGLLFADRWKSVGQEDHDWQPVFRHGRSENRVQRARDIGPAFGLERIDLNEALRGVAALIQPRTRIQGTRLVTELDPAVPAVLGSRVQLEQVVVNLMNNGLDAIDRGGVLTLRSRKDDAGVLVEVVDTGTGIPPEIRQRIFEPFFTTKPVGKGTGLGLSISWEIVRQHGGTIGLQSDVGRGTTMQVRLPRAA